MQRKRAEVKEKIEKIPYVLWNGPKKNNKMSNAGKSVKAMNYKKNNHIEEKKKKLNSHQNISCRFLFNLQQKYTHHNVLLHIDK